MTIKGSVDRITTTGAEGWIYDSAANRPVVVEAVVHHRVVGETMADAFRHDLAAVGFGDGRCGFALAFNAPIEPAYLPFVAIRPAGGDVELPRMSLSGYAEHLGALHSALPCAGRQRSVFGGLWTDRVDALAMLEARRAIGRFDTTVAGLLERLIVHGHAILDGARAREPVEGGRGRAGDGARGRATPPAAGAGDGSEADALEQRLAESFFRPLVQDLLVAAFDDSPVVTAGRVLRAREPGFRQAPTGQGLASPVECAALLAPDGPMSIEVVRGSHQFPDFTRSGQARWLATDGEAALDHAAASGAAVETLTLRAGETALLAAGTLFRVPQPPAEGATEALCLPRRRLPLRPSGGRPYRLHAPFLGRIALADAA